MGPTPPKYPRPYKSSKKLLGTQGIATRSKKLLVAPGLTTSNKKLYQ